MTNTPSPAKTLEEMHARTSGVLLEAMAWMHTNRTRGWVDLKVFFLDGRPDRYELTTMTAHKPD